MLHQRITFFILPLSLASASFLPSWLHSAERRATSLCGVRGYIDDDNNYFWSNSKNLASYDACSARCARNRRCESFGFDEGQTCMLFDDTLAGNLERDRSSEYIFYDAACIKGAGKPATTTTTTSSGRSTIRTSATRTRSAVQPTLTPFATGGNFSIASNSTTTVFVVATATQSVTSLVVATQQESGAQEGSSAVTQVATASDPSSTEEVSVEGSSFPTISATGTNSTIFSNSTMFNVTSR